MSAPALSVSIQGQGIVSADNLNTYEQTCDNVADLRAFIGAQGVQVYMRGFFTPGDGGQGEFYWNASGTGPDDGGVTKIVPSNAGTGCWTRLQDSGGGGANAFGTYLVVDSSNAPANARIFAASSNLSLTDGGPLGAFTIGTGAFTGDITTSANSFATTIGANKVTYSKFQQASPSTLIGNSSGSTANIGEITLGSNLSFAGSVLNSAGTAVGGISGQLQYNNAGVLGGITGATTDGNTVTFTTFAASTSGTGPQAGTGYAYYHIQVTSDNLALNGPSGPGKVDGLLLQQNFGNSSTLGGRQTIYGVLTQDAVTSATNYDRNYVAVVGQVITAVGDGGVSGTELGAYFGANFYARAATGATFLANLTAAEFNTNAQTGSSVKYKSGIQIHGIDAVQGTSYDCMIGLSNTGAATIGWKNALLIGPMASQHPVATSGTLIATSGSSTVTNGIDFSSYTFSGSIFKGPNFSATTSALNLTASSHGIEIGAVGSTNTPFIDMHSSSSSTDHDVRLIASGGTASAGNGNLTIDAIKMILSNASGFGVSSDTTATHSMKLQAYNTNTAAFVDFIVFTSNNPPTCTIDGAPIGGITPAAGAFTNVTVTGSSAPTNGIYLQAANTVGIAARSLLALVVTNPASAVNYWSFQGAATGTPGYVQSSAFGSDTLVGMKFNTKGTAATGQQFYGNTNTGNSFFQINGANALEITDNWWNPNVSYQGATTGWPVMSSGALAGGPDNIAVIGCNSSIYPGTATGVSLMYCVRGLTGSHHFTTNGVVGAVNIGAITNPNGNDTYNTASSSLWLFGAATGSGSPVRISTQGATGNGTQIYDTGSGNYTFASDNLATTLLVLNRVASGATFLRVSPGTSNQPILLESVGSTDSGIDYITLGAGVHQFSQAGAITCVIETGPLSAGGWIDMPTTGASGIGTGGPGVNLMMGYCAGANYFFGGTATGDYACRNANGKKTHIGIDNGSGTAVPAISVSTVATFNNGGVFNTVQLNTTATTNMMWIPTCNGTPTGAPSTPYSGAVALMYDTSTDKIWALNGGTWRATAALT